MPAKKKAPRRKAAKKAAPKKAAKKAAKRKPATKPKAKKAPKRRAPSPPATEFHFVNVANQYIEDVIKGFIPACKWVRLACKRHKRDLASSITKGFPYEFDPARADAPCRFFEKLPHVKGKWAKKDPETGKRLTLKLEPWQAFIFCMIFGWVRKDNGKRRFTRARIYIPRKNGKSFIAAAVGWWMLAKDGEPGAEVYAGATSQAQAWKVFQPARQMALVNRNLPAAFGVSVNAESLVIERDGSIFKPIIGKPGDGDSPHCAITDEYHEHKTSDQIDTMETGMGSREQPLSMVISTAGNDISSPCREDWKNCEKILEGIEGFDDETTFCIIYGIDEKDKWDTEEALRKANPNWGISIDPHQMLASLKTAQNRASKQNAFRTKHLNQWVAAKSAYFNLVEWEALKRDITPEDYKDCPCILAGDLANKRDITALIKLFCLPDKRFAVFGKYYLPESALVEEENQHYRKWHLQGYLETAGEAVIDYDYFKEDVRAACDNFQVLSMPTDPARAWGVMPSLEKEGIPVVEYKNTVLTMSEPMKELEAMIADGRIIHNGDPVLAWAISNVTAKEDKKENVFPNKESAKNKIDPVVSLIMAVGMALRRTDDPDAPYFSF